MEPNTEGFLSTTGGETNFQPIEFELDWWGTIIDWFPRLFFSLLPLVPTIINMRKNKGKKTNGKI